MQGPLCLGKAQYQTTRPVFVFGIVLNNFGIIIQSLPHFLNRNIPDNALINSMSGKFKLLICYFKLYFIKSRHSKRIG